MELLGRISRFGTAVFYTLATIPATLAQLPEPPPIPGTVDPNNTTADGLKTAIANAIAFVLDFLALIAIIFIIVAGIRLIVSQGEEEQKDKAKKTILYVILGLIVVLLARVIVGFFTTGGIVTDIIS